MGLIAIWGDLQFLFNDNNFDWDIYVVSQVTIYVRCQLYFFIESDFHKYESDYIEILGLYINKYDKQTYLANKSILRLKNLMFNYS